MQQVNLYKIEEKPEPTIITFKNMVYIGVGIIILLSLLTSVKVVSYYNHHRKLMTLQENKTSLEVKLEKIQQQIPAKDEKKIKELQELELTTTQLKKMQDTLTQLQLEDKAKFSAYFIALSRYSVVSLWFTNIKISAGGQKIILEGNTLDADKVPKLLKKLGEDSAFAGKTFETFALTTNEKEKLVKFFVGSN